MGTLILTSLLEDLAMVESARPVAESNPQDRYGHGEHVGKPAAHCGGYDHLLRPGVQV